MTELDERRDIQTCREHHAHIEELLRRFPSLDVAAAEEFASGLDSLKTMLLRHLKFEDDYLYPRLQRSPDPEIVATASRYQAEMGGLAPQCVAFFGRWPDAATIAGRFDAFVADWTGVRGLLERRILAEDNELYELAERL